MRCDLTESKLNALLDDRESIDSDFELTSHLLDCPACAELADAYSAIHQLGELAGDCRVDIASRVVLAATDRSARIDSGSNSQRWLPHWAVAAAVLFIATTVSFYARGPQVPKAIDVPIANVPPAHLTPLPEAIAAIPIQPLDGRIFQATGRTLATLPLAVMGRDVSTTADGTQAVQRIFETFRDWSRTDKSAPASPTGETGWNDLDWAVVVA